MSKTPETDEIVTAYEQQRESVGGIISHAEQLETERDQLKKEVAELQERVKYLVSWLRK